VLVTIRTFRTLDVRATSEVMGMEMLRRLEPIALLLMVIGALNWGILGLTGGDTNVIAEIFGTGTFTDVLYVIVGVAALVYLPRLFEAFHIGHGVHPRGV
jgi:uncharacterized membrane protein YuzA (DUF378 family)